MGILDSIKGRFMRRKEDTGFMDVRSHVLGETPPAPMLPEEQRLASRYPTPGDRFGPTRPEEPPAFEEPAPFERKPLTFDDELSQPAGAGFGFEKPAEPEEASRNYELIDRLNIIEAQLQAIRSQTETINERLKNMEMRLPRRY